MPGWVLMVVCWTLVTGAALWLVSWLFPQTGSARSHGWTGVRFRRGRPPEPPEKAEGEEKPR